MELKMSYVFGRIWVDIVDYDVYADVVDQCFCAGTVVYGFCYDVDGWHFWWCVEVDLVHSNVGMYFQIYC